MVRCEYEGCDYEFDDEPSPRPADIIGKWFRRGIKGASAHKIVQAHYYGTSTVAVASCGFRAYVWADLILQRKPKTVVCRRCVGG